MTKVLPFDRRKSPRTVAKATTQLRPAQDRDYTAFDQLDGSHPWQSAVPASCLMYDVRLLSGGKVAYFNFDLAKEMGLIGSEHPEKMNRRLEEKLLETFCIRIINEWDKEHGVIFPKGSVKKNRYMATRYLQLQHADKAGRTSGDGRCIWNGIVKHGGKTWDISSRGTGVTALAPGVVEAGKPLRSGNTEHGYGCGMAEIDELYAAAIMAEIFHRHGMPTERVLAIIDLGRGMGIGVRAGSNLLRPAHLFALLRQGNLPRLKSAVDYLIDRQNSNGKWNFTSQSRRRYQQMLTRLTHDFAKFAAHLDREYIFAWLDWDGDNVLADAGIIDYGSVRQFGLRHDQYRYDDIERFSTSLNQQRAMSRLIVQTYTQIADYLETGRRRPLEKFRGHAAVRLFDELFQQNLLDRFLYQIGFDDKKRRSLLNSHRQTVQRFYDEFSYLERKKTYRREQRVADGVNRPAIFNMRQVLSELPTQLFLHISEFDKFQLAPRELLEMMLSDYAMGPDRRLTKRLARRLDRFQNLYKKLIQIAAPSLEMRSPLLLAMGERAQVINRRDRITGNALIHVVDELLKARRRGMSDPAIQDVMTAIIVDQTLPLTANDQPQDPTASATRELLSQVLSLLDSHKEEI